MLFPLNDLVARPCQPVFAGKPQADEAIQFLFLDGLLHFVRKDELNNVRQ
jgi:hypothetical protein